MRAARRGRAPRELAKVLACAAVALGAALPVRAQAPTLDGLTLRWSAPAECPDETAVRALILGHLPSGKREARAFVADARITADGALYHMELELRGDGTQARRTVDDPSCGALADVAALLVALALDPASAASAEGAAPTAGPEPGGESAPVDANQERTPPASAERAGERAAAANAPATRAGEPVPGNAGKPAAARATEPAADDGDAGPVIGFELGAALRLDAGMLPQTPALGLASQLGLRIDRVRARAAVTFWLEARADAENYPGAELEASGIAGDAAVCVELVSSPVALEPCLAVELGELVLRTDGISMPATSTATWAAAGGGVRAAYRATRWLQLGLDALALAPFARPRWLIRTEQEDVELFVSARVALRISASIAYVFE